MALAFVYGLDFEQREIVRHNWDALGYEYWFPSGMVEYWRHPVTRHIAELATY